MVACEARQIWGKLFNKMGLDDTKSQIRYLRQQLKELGMPSRMSMEAAKKIGARRALEKEARELGIELDDVETPENPNEASEGEEKKSLRTAARPKRAAALKRPPPKQRIRIDSEGDLEEEASQDGDSDSESEESDSEGASENGEDDASSSSASSSEAATDGEDDEDGKPSKKKRVRFSYCTAMCLSQC